MRPNASLSRVKKTAQSRARSLLPRRHATTFRKRERERETSAETRCPSRGARETTEALHPSTLLLSLRAMTPPRDGVSRRVRSHSTPSFFARASIREDSGAFHVARDQRECARPIVSSLSKDWRHVPRIHLYVSTLDAESCDWP